MRHLNKNEYQKLNKDIDFEDLTVGDTWVLIVDLGIATYEELELITGINGYSIETLNDVICFKTGYDDIEQYLESEGL